MVELEQLKSLAKGVLMLVNLFIAWLVFIPILPILLILFIFKSCVILVAKICHLQLRPLSGHDLLNAMDKLALNDSVKFEYERTPLSNLSVFGKFCEPRSPVNMDEIGQRFQRYLNQNTEFGWKFKSCLVRFCGYSFFQEVPKFNVSAQIRKANLNPQESVNCYFNRWTTQPYSLESPLWEILVLEKGSECFLAFKMHHIIGDGISLTQILDDVFGFKQHRQLEEFVNSEPPRYSVSQMIFLILFGPALAWELLFKGFLATDPFKIKIGIPVEQYMSTITLNLNDVKFIAKKEGVSFNSVLLTIYSGAIQRLLRDRNQKLPTSFMVPIAQPWPGRPKDFIGNKYGVIMPCVPLNITDPLQLLHKIQARTTRIYKSGIFLIFNHVFLNVMSLFPYWLQTKLRRCTNETTAMSPMLAGEYLMYDGNVMELPYILTGMNFPHFGIKMLTLSIKTRLVWTVIGSRSVFERQDELDMFTKKYISDAFEELFSGVNKQEDNDKNIKSEELSLITVSK